MGIHRSPHSSCCFLNTNIAVTRQLIGTARTLEAECWQVCGDAWVRGQRKMSQILDAFGLLDFTMLRPVLAWRAFWNLRTVYFFNFPNFFGPRPTAFNWNRGYGVPAVCVYIYMYIYVYIYIYILRAEQTPIYAVVDFLGKSNLVIASFQWCKWRDGVIVPEERRFTRLYWFCAKHRLLKSLRFETQVSKAAELPNVSRWWRLQNSDEVYSHGVNCTSLSSTIPNTLCWRAANFYELFTQRGVTPIAVPFRTEVHALS